MPLSFLSKRKIEKSECVEGNLAGAHPPCDSAASLSGRIGSDPADSIVPGCLGNTCKDFHSCQRPRSARCARYCNKCQHIRTAISSVF